MSFRVLVERKIRKDEEYTGLGLFIFLSWASNAAAFVTECCGIEVSDFKHISSSGLNAAALSCECRSIGHTDFQNFFFLNVNAAALGNEYLMQYFCNCTKPLQVI